MEFPSFDPNTKLTAVYYNSGTPPHLFRMSWIKSTVNSTTETQGGWSVLTIDVHCPAQPDLFVSAG